MFHGLIQVYSKQVVALVLEQVGERKREDVLTVENHETH